MFRLADLFADVSTPAWLWVAFTLAAATAQTFRNATQKGLTARLGTAGATHIRFLFGLPFGLLALGDRRARRRRHADAERGVARLDDRRRAQPDRGDRADARGDAGALLRRHHRLHEDRARAGRALRRRLPRRASDAQPRRGRRIATAGVVALSWPSKAGAEIFSWRPALLGVASGALFALAAVAFRGGITALGTPAYLPAATLTLAISLAVQTVLLSLWLMIRSPAVLTGVLAAWKPSLPAGFLGAFASEMWFLAFALQTPARVRTLGLVEILIAGMVSRRLFQQAPGLRDIFGMVLVVLGIALLFNT